MVKVKSLIKFNCGCGFQSSDSRAAIEHAAKRQHTLHIHGTIEPDVVETSHTPKRLSPLEQEKLAASRPGRPAVAA